MTRLLIIAFALGCAWLQTWARLPELVWAGLLPLVAWLAWRLPIDPARFIRHSREGGNPGLTQRRWIPGQARNDDVAVNSFRLNNRLGRNAVILLLALWAGVFYAAWRADVRLADELPRLWEGRDVRLTARVVGLPETTPSGLRFVVAVARVATAGARLPERMQVSVFTRPDEPRLRVGAGDCLEFTARLHRPHGQINPGGFDYEAWMLERGLRASGSLVGLPVPGVGCGGGARAVLDRVREALRTHLRDALNGAPNSGIVVALAVGDQDAITSAQWTLFRQTGVTHLFSVSGLHITLFSTLVFLVVRSLWASVPALALRLPAAKAGILLGLLAALLYTALSGFGVPAQRTLYMLAGAAVTAWLDRDAGASRLLAAGLLLVLLIDPWAALSPGFWLSFGAVAALLFAHMGRLVPGRGWRAWGGAQWAVTLAITPLLLAWFHEVSLVSPLANAFAIPVISVIVVPLVLAAAVLPGAWLALIAHALVGAVMAGLEALARLPQPVLHAAAPDAWALGLALLGTALLLLPRGVPARWLGWVLCLPLLFPRIALPAAGEAWLTLLDVGQGEAVLVRTRDHSLLFDAGPRFFSGEDAGARVVAPHLWSQGIKRLEGLVLSHADLDHVGGAASLIASHRPGWVLSSIAGHPLEARREAGLEVLRQRPDTLACAAGQTWTWEGVRFSVLHPPAHHYAHPGFSENERSCVLRIDTAYGSALITGDAERLAEMNLAERKQPLRADVLVAGHHGSNSSSTAEFLAAVRPRWVLLTVGHRNRYGHPHPEALARLHASGAEIARTDREGALTLRLGGAAPSVERARVSEARYWRE